MTRVLLTGGSGFIAAHTLELLLKRGHSVVTTVRSQAKADKISEAYPNVGKDKLSFTIVEDIAQEGAFEKAVVSDPPFEAVLHTASPFHFNVTDVQKQLLDPAIIGTTGILKSIKAHAPTIKRVVITSSFASIINPSKGAWPEHIYSESDWNPITESEAVLNPANGYRASKTFAERASWDFIEKEKPNFTIATINPPLVLGPIVHHLNSLDALNTSNERIRNFIQGKSKDMDDSETPNPYIWVDVRDVAEAHVNAMERDEAANKRFFTTAGYFSNKEVVQIIRKNFEEYADQLPPESWKGGDYPSKKYGIDNSRCEKILGIKWVSLEKSVVDTVKSLKEVGA
ncbi:NAD(P)-binding protein [Microthyrium microscopicum]|uniref:NAD(P)-binding protein n=1 Tax=Microthyrium microscopicum TaxID=703497 RepID=A0A6A6TWV2_9PEZI|nr:NAD(P)-binding protein [Microthyrium microscopicum]